MIHQLSKMDKCIMEFCIAAPFTDSLSRLTGKEQKAVKTNASDLQPFKKLLCKIQSLTMLCAIA
jgi:hypothetical protein